MNFIDGFNKGGWLKKAGNLVGDKAKLVALLASLSTYMQKGGLKNVQEQLKTLYNYINDIVRGNYKQYSTKALVLAVAAIIYVVSPFDIIPDILLGLGFIDDAAIVTWAIAQIASELAKYQEWKEGPEDIPFEEIS